MGRKEREKRKKKEGKKRGEAEREKITRQRRKRKRSYVREEERERRIEGDETMRYEEALSPCSRTRTVDENARWGRPRRNREQEQDENGGRVGEVEARARGAADREGEEAAVG